MIPQHQLQSGHLILIGPPVFSEILMLFHPLPEAAEMQHTGPSHGLALYKSMDSIIEGTGVPVQADNDEPYLALRESSS